MARLRLTIAYKGTDLHGWQVQEHATRPRPRTVQGVLEPIVSRMAGEQVRLHAAGRTDAGVHADGQVAHVDIPDHKLDVDWQKAINAQLPDDICILDVRRAADDFHARFDALGKRYTYRLWLTRRFIPPKLHGQVWATGPLDVYAMDRAARHLAGTHDFAAFQNQGTDVTSTVRTVHAIRRCPSGTLPAGALLTCGEPYTSWRCTGTHPDQPPATARHPLAGIGLELVWSFEGDGFLKQMVRNMMGLLVAVGRGALAADDVPGIMATLDRSRAPATAPACGLTLSEVYYPPCDYPYAR